MTRRDRAALALAYECLRRLRRGKRSLRGHAIVTLGRAQQALYEGHDGTFDGSVACDIDAALDDARDPLSGNAQTRLLRARLALLIRAALRADAIERDERETGWALDTMRTHVVCSGCGEEINYKHGEVMTVMRDGAPDICPRTKRIETARNAIPLWQQAPATRSR